ncbi:MAG: hypothetical protein JWN78_1524 [Bacteroidota bacterium]|nr:hypothetical protein [Bacteroidota bacterium]
MNKTYKVFGNLIGFLLFSTLLSAQEPVEKKYINMKALGGFIENGIPYYHLPEGTLYRPVLFVINYHQPFFKAKKFFNMGMDFSPMIGFAAGKYKGMEAGLNGAIILCFAVKASNILSIQAGSGPHYFSYPTSRQAKGFIFANNFLLEYRRRIGSKKIELNFNCGFRHISNASTKQPNGGVNNIIVGFGVSKLW